MSQLSSLVVNFHHPHHSRDVVQILILEDRLQQVSVDHKLIAVDHHLQVMEGQNEIRIHTGQDLSRDHVPPDVIELDRGHSLPDHEPHLGDVGEGVGVIVQGAMLGELEGAEVQAIVVIVAMMIGVEVEVADVEAGVVDKCKV
jgi:hypothetical protein